MIPMRALLVSNLLVVLLAGGGFAESHGDVSGESAAPPAPAFVSQGADLYQRYCASCHGLGARGDGPVAASLRTPPPDLTAIAARRGGSFPAGEIASWIDGRFEPGAHGTREMPVWGIALRNALPDTGLEQEIVRGQIDMLVDYLRTLQVEP